MPNRSGFESDDQLEVANALVDLQIKAIGDRAVAQKLTALRKQVWEPSASGDAAIKEASFKQALEGLSPDQTMLLCESYARMGDLYEVAGLTARDNYFTYLKSDKNKPIPGGVEEFIQAREEEKDDVKTIVAKLGVPVFEPIFTMHPTNVKALPPMKALRKVALALREGDAQHLEQSVADYQNTPILHEDKDGNKINLMVRDETKTVLNFLGNIYEDLPGIFDQYDKPLRAKFPDYSPLELKLNARFGSWGSAGDKDGNDNVTAEKTLEAIARHTHDIVERYIADLKDMHISELAEWKKKLGGNDGQGGIYKELKEILEKAEKLTNATNAMRAASLKKNKEEPQKPLTPEEVAALETQRKALSSEFDALSQDLSELRHRLQEKVGGKSFEEALTAAYEFRSGDEADKMLEMVRKVRWFGFNFSKIEYRETAGEYTKAVAAIISPDDKGKSYMDMTPAGRVAKLTEMLKPGTVSDEMQKAMEKAGELLKNGADKALAFDKGVKDLEDMDRDKTAITYHTLRRMELARDNPRMIRDNVLAECGKPEKKDATPAEVVDQGVAHLLEAQFLQQVVAKDGKRPLLGIVPLFEEPDTMEHCADLMRAAYKNPAYAHHMELLAADPDRFEYGGKKTQQVQIAHSDSRRRSGSLGGTALIHEAHKKLRKMNEEEGVQTQFYEGGSLSDPFRNGVRSITAQVNAFALHDFAKFTFQGGDMFNYFNHPGSNERIFTRHFVHPATRVQKEGEEFKVGRNGNGDAAYKNSNSNGRPQRDRRPNSVIEEVAIEALKMTLADYAEKDFTKEALGTLYAALGVGYEREASAANRGSRAKSRGGMSKVDSIKVGAIIPMDPLEVRTISFSAFPQLNLLTPSPVGGEKLDEYIKAAILKRLNHINSEHTGTIDTRSEEEIFFVENFGDIVKKKEVQPKHMELLYDKSPAFRDAIDKSAFAVARTDMDAVEADVMPKFDALGEGDPIGMQGKKYVARLKDTFKKIGHIAYEAIMGVSDKPTWNNIILGNSLGIDRVKRFGRNDVSKFQRHDSENASVQAAAMEALNGLGEEIALKNQYQDFIVYAKSALNRDGKLPKTKQGEDVLATLVAAGLTATHGRWLGADDPLTATSRRALVGQHADKSDYNHAL